MPVTHQMLEADKAALKAEIRRLKPEGRMTKYKLSGAMNSKTLRMIRADLDEMAEVIAINGGAGCVATFELPNVGMVEGANPSPEYLEAQRICDAANRP